MDGEIGGDVMNLLEELSKQKEKVDKAVEEFVDNMTKKTSNPVVITEATVKLASASVLALREIGDNELADTFVELFLLQTCRVEDFLRISGKMMQKIGLAIEEWRRKEKEKKEKKGGDEKDEKEGDKGRGDTSSSNN
ncbi:MAG: hypothetical protein DRP01_01525 [Archaeoglobales archaeon]|nr:MAG: hypothetical protein DRP01_01525 [Archaeoglobales archaeon]